MSNIDAGQVRELNCVLETVVFGQNVASEETIETTFCVETVVRLLTVCFGNGCDSPERCFYEKTFQKRLVHSFSKPSESGFLRNNILCSHNRFQSKQF